MEILYEAHARERMLERGVGEQDVELTLQQPDRQRLARPSRAPCLISERRIGDRICKVYTRIGSDPPVVATVAWHGV